jgi:putative membrane protein
VFGWGYGGTFWFGRLFMFFWVIVIIAVVIMLLRHSTRFHGYRSEWHTQTALDVLKKRYASGEIDKKEYDEKRKDIEG